MTADRPELIRITDRLSVPLDALQLVWTLEVRGARSVRLASGALCIVPLDVLSAEECQVLQMHRENIGRLLLHAHADDLTRTTAKGQSFAIKAPAGWSPD